MVFKNAFKGADGFAQFAGNASLPLDVMQQIKDKMRRSPAWMPLGERLSS
jgi:hypothetical protein